MSLFLRTLALYSLTAIIALAASSETTSHFQSGIESYQNSEYEIAKTQFTVALELEKTAAAHHNLGLVYFKLNAPAEAVWQLERAQLLEPFNADYRYKLETVRQELGLFAGSAKWYTLASAALPSKTWLILATVSFWLLLAVVILPRLRETKANIGLKALRGISITVFILSIPSLWLHQRLLQTGTIISDEAASLHAAPASAAPSSGTARPGERARILDHYNHFSDLETEGHSTGWISKVAFSPLAD